MNAAFALLFFRVDNIKRPDNKTFSIELAVRDYECDLQGIVNNAVYLNYLEHTRHEYLRHLGFDFAEMHRQNVDPVVTRMELDYKRPLTSGDIFLVLLRLSRKGRLRYIFNQEIHDIPEMHPVLFAKVDVAFLSNGRPVVPPSALIAAIKPWLI